MGTFRNNIRTQRKTIWFFVLLIPFFKLLSFGLFQERQFGTSFFKALELIYDGGRVLAATYGFFLLVKHRFRIASSFAKAFILFFVLQLTVCVVNRSLDGRFILKIYSYIGFVLLVDYYCKQSLDTALKATELLFGTISILGILVIIVFPLGLLRGTRVYDAIYLTGGKNTAFPFYYLFLLSLFLFYNSTRSVKGLPSFWYVPMALMMICAVICQSMSTLVALFLMALFSVLFVTVKPEFKTYLPVIILYCLLALIYIGTNIPVVSNLLGVFGRNSTFSNRTTIWSQAFEYIAKSPFFGSGDKLTFVIGTNTTDHAHSWYLDTLTKYGVFTLTFFLAIVGCTYRNISHIKYKPLRCYIGMFLLVYLYHMGFDDYNFNFAIFSILVVNHFSVQINKSELEKLLCL